MQNIQVLLGELRDGGESGEVYTPRDKNQEEGKWEKEAGQL